MRSSHKMTYLCGIIWVILIVATITTSAPTYGEMDNNIQELLDALYQQDLLNDRFSGVHQVVRKAGRSPSLRLRFGRRSDPALSPGAAYLMAQQAQADEN
ncbi:hypothetical protein WA026_004160 [Henosepilachna vigintioctopunctata]|uniref:Short neuropeptide F n=1 Tax=Henosepilachna vigintioctopunctata TaxID=420089 RepID=A0AAW1UFL8_9CUCU